MGQSVCDQVTLVNIELFHCFHLSVIQLCVVLFLTKLQTVLQEEKKYIANGQKHNSPHEARTRWKKISLKYKILIHFSSRKNVSREVKGQIIIHQQGSNVTNIHKP